MAKNKEKETKPNNLEAYFKELYEKERDKNRELTELLVAAEERASEAERKLDVLKQSKLFKLIKPFRNVYAKLLDIKVRLARHGSIRGIIAKIKSKRIEKQACKFHGTLSFPDEEERKRQREYHFEHNHLFSILVPLYNTPEGFLTQMIESVTCQTYENWELCLADGSDEDHAYVEQIVKRYIDEEKSAGRDRIRYMRLDENRGISGNTNKCCEMATGDYISLLDHDDVLHPSVLFEYAKRIEETDADFIYCDETTFCDDNIDKMITLHFKPDFSPDNLRANNYICHFSMFRASLLEGMELFRSQFDGSQDHDMILRLTRAAKRIEHVPKILYYWRSHEASVASGIEAKTYAIDAAKNAVLDDLECRGIHGAKIESTRAFATIFRIRYPLNGNPLISIVIPNKDHLEDLKRCIESIVTKASYENYELVVVENNSKSKEIFAYYKELAKTLPNFRLVTYKGAFNYSAVCNLGVKNAKGEYILLLNNDTQVISRNFMEELLMYAQREDVGAVGAKLYFGDHKIQHAGIVIGLGAHRSAGHTHYGLSKDNLGYMGRLCYAQDVTAVTGACLMVKKSLYDRVGGLEEKLSVALNDVDFCLKLRREGLLNVFTPFAELFHFESVSRGTDSAEDEKNAKRYQKECDFFKDKWKAELEAGDPYYNPNFSLDHSNYTLKAAPMAQVGE
ncbi:MAG: glycosyltransferase family 2 protein [Lachnospiraceae bacterium]|nr:glycosyltransferase family 2 protein [Lachnospiraceae bacterium]